MGFFRAVENKTDVEISLQKETTRLTLSAPPPAFPLFLVDSDFIYAHQIDGAVPSVYFYSVTGCYAHRNAAYHNVSVNLKLRR
jgi:hypothetical protein